MAAQSPDEFHHPIDLFADMAADTVTEDLFAHLAPLPGLRLEGCDPVPGVDLFLDCRDIACADFDGDGWTDVILAGGMGELDPPSRLLWGRADGLFELTAPAPLPPWLGPTTRADLDGDGMTDVVTILLDGGERAARHDQYAELTRPRRELAILYGRPGRRFEVRSLGVDALDVAVGDLDGDRWLDIVALCGVHWPQEITGLTVFHGSNDFNTVTSLPAPVASFDAAQLLLSDLGSHPKPALHLIDTRILDPWLPMFVLSDPFADPTWTRSPLDVGGISSLPSLADTDLDGRVDLFFGTTDFAGGRNRLYLRTDHGDWLDVGQRAGLWAGYNYTMSSAWGDVDNDRRADLWQCRFFSEGRETESRLYWNRGQATFVSAAQVVSPRPAPGSHRAAWIDTDRDGRLDLLATFATDYRERMPYERCRPLLYRNRSDASTWLQVELTGRPPNTDAIGAVVVAWVGGQPLWRHVGDGSDDGGTAPPLEQHFGLGGAAAADSVVVTWPDGTRQVWRDLAAGTRHTLAEG